MVDFLQFVLSQGGSNMVTTLLICGLGLLILVAFGGWGENKFSKNWRNVLLILAILLLVLSIVCFLFIVKNAPAIMEQEAQDVHEYRVESDNKMTATDITGKALTIIIIACFPAGLLLLLLSILCAQKITEKQQKDLRTYGIWLIIGSLLIIAQTYS